MYSEMSNKQPLNPNRSYMNWAGQNGIPLLSFMENDFFKSLRKKSLLI